MQFIHIPKTAGTSIRHRLGIGFSHKRQSDIEGNSFFTCVRNPYDRLISMYAYSRENNKTLPQESSSKVGEWFNEQIEKPSMINHDISLIEPMSKFITDLTQVTLLRFESLAEDFKKLYDAELSIINFSRRGHYLNYYDNELKEMVLDYYQDDFDMFGYSKELQ